MIKRLSVTVVVLLVVFSLILSMASVALAGQPPGQQGYEGQPGNQGNGSAGYEGQPGNQGNGTGGYEGQPGNQGGH
jgi:hypothetical protein